MQCPCTTQHRRACSTHTTHTRAWPQVHDADGEDTNLMGQAIITVRQLISQEEGEKEKEYPLTNPTMPKREKKLTKSGALCTFKVEVRPRGLVCVVFRLFFDRLDSLVSALLRAHRHYCSSTSS